MSRRSVRRSGHNQKRRVPPQSAASGAAAVRSGLALTSEELQAENARKFRAIVAAKRAQIDEELALGYSHPDVLAWYANLRGIPVALTGARDFVLGPNPFV